MNTHLERISLVFMVGRPEAAPHVSFVSQPPAGNCEGGVQKEDMQIRKQYNHQAHPEHDGQDSK